MLVAGEIKDYELALKYLANTEFYKCVSGVANIFIQQTDIGYNFPSAILFQKRDPENRIPTHILGLYSIGVFLQIILPFNAKDIFMFKRKTEVHFSPPFVFSKPSVPYNLLHRWMQDFSTDMPIQEKEELILQFEELPNACYNSVTHQIQEIKW